MDAMRGQELAAKFDCPYVETSARTNTNVNEAFHTLVRAVMSIKTETGADGEKKSGGKKSKCILS